MLTDEEANVLKAFFDGHAAFRATVTNSLLQLMGDNDHMQAQLHSIQVQIWFLYGTVAVLGAFGAVAYFFGTR